MYARQASFTHHAADSLAFFFFFLDYRLDNENYFPQKMHLMELKMWSQYKFTPTSEQIPQALYGK